ncbi:MAG: DUF3995 domain-containing protein [Sulfuricurvum sp.]|uniref:DUF3995 domain-containing protein n=1 Tax=Sulfuricurvum sp. TaxID=2025608 RepID=UPI00260E0197|nr:DUF3995 domain-containing protein [Sulfuricurvum sp.]MDD2830451.1 DUF3995 domain-containing protein [Sulfuricurvum sp.]MDD4950758.1 DUF3995 domain-containing protein [Sulfuricurvum sp.]
MMSVVTILAIVALSLIGLLHFYWALGGKFAALQAIPTENGKPLINPGKIAAVMVGLALFGFAFVAYILCFYDLSSSPFRDYFIISGWILSGIFTLRGIGEFNAVGLFKKIESSEFAYYDTRFYTPFALFMGMVFAALTYQV